MNSQAGAGSFSLLDTIVINLAVALVGTTEKEKRGVRRTEREREREREREEALLKRRESSLLSGKRTFG